jgi:acyl transferase domain-containing protein/3-hydroxymyristoyl/3-hydroxydecanoyl-(acyl carrier protein) dehydratase
LHPSQQIAIVGIGGIFPGALDVTQFWEHVLAGRSLAREVPPGRWPISPEAAYDPRSNPPQPDKVYSKRACFIDAFTCDLAGLNITRDELDRLDPMFHLLLHSGHAAWQDTVTKNVDRTRTGIIIGNIALPTDASSAFSDEILSPLFEAQLFPRTRNSKLENGGGRKSTDPLNRCVAGLPAAILAQALGLTGTAFTLDAACASSLYALKLAADELLAGRADLMLTGGLSRPDCLYTQMGFSQLHALSPSGRCAPFDARADGLVVGEGSGILALKRLDDALRDGDHIYATIAGIGLSNDIAGNLMQPDSSGQLRALRAAYHRAQWSPEVVDLIECHGTGTPVGDAVEFHSLTQLWSGAAAPVGPPRTRCTIGSVKSNVGHLLTAAGSAGLIKILLAMRDAKLPPTANFSTPAPGISLDNSPFQILRQAADWPRPKNHPRRAAISAFGFGGINAHVLLEQWEARGADSSPAPHCELRTQNSELGTSPAIAIVGMSARFGPWQSLAAVKNRLFATEATAPTHPRHWSGSPECQNHKGHFIDEIRIPLGRFRIPPAELSEMLPQQLLMLQAAADAFDDAGLSEIPPERLDTGVFIGIALDLNTTNFRFRWTMPEKAHRWTRELGLNLTSEQLADWTAQLRTAAGPALNANRTMGALGGIVASRVARAFHIGGPSFTISSEETSPLHALHVATSALQRGDINVALVGAVDLAGDLRAVLGEHAATGAAAPVASSPAWKGAGFSGASARDLLGEGAAALILKRHEDALRDGDRIYAVLDDTAAPRSDNLVNFDTPELGRAGVASALASVVKAALALHHETLTGVHVSACSCRDANTPPESTLKRELRADTQKSELRADTLKRELGAPRYWLHNRSAGPRRATITTTSVAGTRAQVTLQSAVTAPPAPATQLPEHLFLLAAHAPADLLTQLADLEKLVGTAPLRAVARHWHTTHPTPTGRFKLAILAADLPHFNDLLPQARHAISETRALQSDSLCFNPNPEPGKKIAFVYPGSGTHFPHMGYDLSAQFPQILHYQHAENQNLASQFGDDSTSVDNPSPRDAIFAHVSLGCFITDLLAAFALKPHAAIGYSLGESTALFATRTWRNRDAMLARMHASTLFTTDLAGPCHAARRAWNLPENEPVDWLVGIINRPAEAVRQALTGRHRVYLLIINTPNECIIGGQRQPVEQLIADLNAIFHGVPGITTVHCDIAQQVAPAYRDLHLLDTTPPEAVTFYRTATAAPYTPTRDSAADAILAQALAPFDFTQLIRTAHADGIRTFIEVGPGASCCRMIDQILADQPHLARPVCIPNANNVTTLLHLLAHLFTQGRPINLSPLYAHPPEAPEDLPSVGGPTPQRHITVPTGTPEFQVPNPPSPTPSPSLTPIPTPTPALSLTPTPRETQNSELRTQNFASPLLTQMAAAQIAHARAQETFLRLSQSNAQAISQALAFQLSLLQSADTTQLEQPLIDTSPQLPITNYQLPVTTSQFPPCALTRSQCFEFATGTLATCLGPAFAHVDAYPTRVRLPDDPLQLVDRITRIEGTPNALTRGSDEVVRGRVITEHDIHENAWYLDANRIPTCIAVEAGQADLFLSGYLGIDSITKGQAVYRLLDAVVTFHAPLPTPGHTIVYDIRIEEFFRQGDTHLFRFHFDATVNGQKFLTMTKGCAGFFTEAELAAGQGIVQTALDIRPDPRQLPKDWIPLAFTPGQPFPPSERESPDSPSTETPFESYSDDQLTALRDGNLAACFCPQFENLLDNPTTIPGGGGGKMTLVHRILRLDPAAGRYTLGQITGEADIHPDDWFLTCHFVDDRVMPGTLMYECCLHTLRVYLLRMGWVGPAGQVAYEPIPGIASQLKCRGQVTAQTKKVQYEVTLKELGYQADGTPYAIADALMYADGKPIVQMLNMSTRLTGLTKSQVAALWQNRSAAHSQLPITNYQFPTPPLFDTPRITAFATGKPSDAFGDPYTIFDPGQPPPARKIARLPGPPFQFLDRITKIENATPFVLKTGAIVTAEYDVPKDAWYFASNSQNLELRTPNFVMPFSVLLEIALQPCGWLAAYLGSALTSPTDLKFRNLGGIATQFRPVTPNTGTLTTTVKITSVSHSGGMIIQHFDMLVRSREGDVYQGTTYFGFFSKDALANQLGIRDAALFQPTPEEFARAQVGGAFAYPDHAPFPDAKMRMVDHITHYDPLGGPHQLGFIRGTSRVNPDAWFFKAHFFEDPVWPGSLGIESFLQLLKVFAVRASSPTGSPLGSPAWKGAGSSAPNPLDPTPTLPAQHPHATTLFHTHSPQKHSWLYRGQILPTDHLVTIEAAITHRDDPHRLLRAAGHLSVDNRIIYHLKDFTLTMSPS